jgi:hypothetical protein
VAGIIFFMCVGLVIMIPFSKSARKFFGSLVSVAGIAALGWIFLFGVVIACSVFIECLGGNC